MMSAIRYGIAVILLALPTLLVVLWAQGASSRLATIEASESSEQQIAVATQADEEYCTPQLKQILRRVLNSCGLIGRNGDRGCQPVEARNVATMSGEHFNALFTPMQERGGIVQFDQGSGELDEADQQLISSVFAQRRGASYFLVVSRASPEGSVEQNRELSRQRAEAVLSYLSETFRDPELERQIGLLWLGEEYAQLASDFCGWRRSGAEDQCSPEDLNRSAFTAWIDCRL